MSTRKNDNFLSICLEEAGKSPLHYRHGCIIVRGGKVIGTGHNHYRPNWSGGALKTGIAKPASEQKRQQKQKKKKPNFTTTTTTTTVVVGGGSCLAANTPLSMHSEIMALRHALSRSAHASGSSARSTAYFKKPCSKSSDSKLKRKFRLREIRAYIEAVCCAAEGTSGRIETSVGLRQGEEWCFEPDTCRRNEGQQQHRQRSQRGEKRGEARDEREEEREEGAEEGVSE